MTRKEMSEIFAALLLAYPHAEVFKGGIQKLGPTINLWTACLSEIDFWTGQQAVIKLCRVCKFPPTIAEFREQADNVKSEVQQRVNSAWTLLRFDLEDKSPSEVYAALDERSQTKLAIAAMGGPEKLIVQSEHVYGDGRREPYTHFDYHGFAAAYERLLKQSIELTGISPKPLTSNMKQIEGRR